MIAKRKAEIHGKGLLDEIHRRLPFIREGPGPSVREWIRKKGGLKIKSITLAREPVKSGIQTVLNLITFGKFQEAKNRLGYDSIYHLFMILVFEDGSRLRMDKNQVVQISGNIPNTNDQVSVQGPNVSLGELLGKTEAMFGKNRTWVYNPTSNNCQRFVSDVLKANGLLTSSLDKYILQDAKQLLPPSIGSRIATALTDVAARADSLLYGRGNHKRYITI